MFRDRVGFSDRCIVLILQLAGIERIDKARGFDLLHEGVVVKYFGLGLDTLGAFYDIEDRLDFLLVIKGTR